MKKLLVVFWLITACFLIIGRVYAWEVPGYVRADAGVRMWFSVLEGDLIQSDRTKIGIAENMGLKKDKLAWEFFADLRVHNAHVFRLNAEPGTVYDQSVNGSYEKIRDWRLGYDLDFYMTPQFLFGANIDLVLAGYDTRVSNAVVGAQLYNYNEYTSLTFPTIGLHGAFYPIFENISLRPKLGGRVNWWNYNSLETWRWEVLSGVDIPVNMFWTWSISGGYRADHIKFKSNTDTQDINRTGFFLETSVLF